MTVRALLVPLAALALVVVVGLSTPWRAALIESGAWRDSDFQILYAAGQGLVEGRDIHDPSVLDEVGRRTGRPATPFCAANPLVVRLFGLLGGSGFRAAYQRWLWVGAGLAALTVLSLAGALRGLGLSRGLALGAALVLVAVPAGFWQSVAMNSTNLVALAALAGALAAAVHDRPLLEGGLIAVAALAKTSPALVLVAALLAGRRRTALAGLATLTAAGLASIAWTGWAIHASWLTRVLPRLGYAPEVPAGRFDNSLHAWNLAPHGWLARTAEQGGWSRDLVAVGAWAVALLVLWQLVTALRGLAQRPAGARSPTDGTPPTPGGADRLDADRPIPAADQPTDGTPGLPGAHRAWRAGAVHALAVAASLLLSSVTWPHHLVLLAVPGAWLVARWAVRGTGPARVLGVAALALTVLPLGSLSTDVHQTADVALRTVACLLVLGACTAEAAGLSGDGPSAPGGDRP